MQNLVPLSAMNSNNNLAKLPDNQSCTVTWYNATHSAAGVFINKIEGVAKTNNTYITYTIMISVIQIPNDDVISLLKAIFRTHLFFIVAILLCRRTPVHTERNCLRYHPMHLQVLQHDTLRESY